MQYAKVTHVSEKTLSDDICNQKREKKKKKQKKKQKKQN